MANITINNISYASDTLSEEARAQVQNIRFVDQELDRLKARIAVFQTARITYAKALQQALPATDRAVDSIKMN